MEVMAGFIVGFDNDPEDIFERQIEFIRESAIPLAMVGMLNALPDTQLWRRLEREGRLLGEDATGNNTISYRELRSQDGCRQVDPGLPIDHEDDLQAARVLPARARLVEANSSRNPRTITL